MRKSFNKQAAGNTRHSDIAGICLASRFFLSFYFFLPESFRSFNAATIAWRETVNGKQWRLRNMNITFKLTIYFFIFVKNWRLC